MTRRYAALVAALVLVAGASGAAAWTAVGRWRGEAPRVIEAQASAGIVGHDGTARPVRLIPPVEVEAQRATSREAEGQGESAVYARAHHAHFVEDAPAHALAAWNAYLSSYPAGTFALEAKYNRALCLARLGRFAEASAALHPFARGQFGAYRRDEAARLLDWVAARTVVR